MSLQSQDASMMDGGRQITDADWGFSPEAVDWILKNKAKLEEQVQKQKARENKLWSLEEWEEFEKWGNNEHTKLKRLETEHLLLAEQLADCQLKARVLQETFSDLPEDYRIGMFTIERLVRNEVGIGEYDVQILAPPVDNERIIDRFRKLVELMVQNHKMKDSRGCLC